MGLFLGEVYTENPFNLKGNRESERIVVLNNTVLEKNGGVWCSPPTTIGWDEAQVLERDAIIRDMTVASGGSMWGFKDPRCLFTFPFWAEGLGDFQLVGTFRHPLSVAQSLYFRNQIPLDEGLALWRAYNERLLELLQCYRFPLVSFDVDADQYLASVKRVAAYLGLSGGPVEGHTFFEESLRKQREYCAEPVPDDCRALYLALQDFYLLNL
ncbi:MAG: hypothetical protein OEL57_16405 [Trichlorobacter sp.]|uniref:hypothetical protein n=1 Tax=Trichlorobacter sp. TaxID=2911007 RepID=UPI002563C074|nr:hypothetical protein [Trichlorobacter sp.]MDK9719464.1 hypothetical protein [Trichlorobacter sp.]